MKHKKLRAIVKVNIPAELSRVARDRIWHIERDVKASWRSLPSSGPLFVLSAGSASRRQRPAAGLPAQSSASLVRSDTARARRAVLHHLPQRSREPRACRSRPWTSIGSPTARSLGKGRAKAARRDDAASGHAPAGSATLEGFISHLESSIDKVAGPARAGSVAAPSPPTAPEYASAIRTSSRSTSTRPRSPADDESNGFGAILRAC
jgi:hypothetical protein